MCNKLGKPLLFLTGCVNPKGMHFTKLQNAEERRQQYISAIRFYLVKTNLQILFIENSGNDLSEEFEKEISNGRVEVLTFIGNDYNKALGKGYGEMSIIEFAIENSKFLENSTFVFKVTGRYKLLNINTFIKHIQNSRTIELIVDFRKSLSFADSRFWGCSILFLEEYLLKYKDYLNDSSGFYFEHALCKATHEAIVNGISFSFFKYFPRFKGIYGTENTEYNASWINWFPKNIKYALRHKLMTN